MSSPDAIATWFESQRGINRDTLRFFDVSVLNGKVLFPYSNGTKERPDPTVPLREDQRRFYFTRNKTPDLFQPPFQPAGERAFLVEGETDTMRMWQETAGSVPVFGIGGVNTWHSGLAEQLAQYEQVFVILDNDDDYMVKSQVDNAWRKIRSDVRRARRIQLPNDVKDCCEFFDRYDAPTLKLLTQKMGSSRFKPVDFNQPPPPVEWLLDGWIAKGDVTVLAGAGGLGKSLVVQALALAVIRGDAECLGQKVNAHGPALLVDEENPADVVYSRMLAFGLDPAQHAGSLRYLWNQGVRLDQDPDTLYDEVMDFRPVLVGLDSLSRLHSKDENARGEIGAIIDNAIKPLARDTGAGVILIHHHDKGGNGPRGSTDIVNAADAVIDVFGGQDGQFTLRLSKSRRRARGAEIHVLIEDSPDLRLRAVPSIVAPIF